MALVTANNEAVLSLSLVMPRTGAWHADLHVDSLTPLTGAVTIGVGDLAMVLKGIVAPGRTGEMLDVNQLRVVGGAGGLGLTAKPKRYQHATISIVLRDLLAAAGETLDPVVDGTVLAAQVDDFTVRAVPVGAAITELVAAYAPAGTGWRILPGGTFWIGVETWPGAVFDSDTVQLADQDDETRTMKLYVDQPFAVVGTTFLGEKISMAEFHMTGANGAPVEADLWFEPVSGAEDVDRMKAALMAIIRATPPGLDPRTWFWATVVQQAGQTISVNPDDPGLPDMGGVALAMPPGDTVEGVTGGRVLVGFTGRDRKAVAHGFQGGTPAKRVIDAGATFIGGEAGAEPPPMGATLLLYLAKMAAAINTLAGSPVVELPTPALLAKKTNVA